MQQCPPNAAQRRGRFCLARASVAVIGIAVLVVPASSAHGLRQLDRPVRAQIGFASAIPEGRLSWAAAPTGFWGGEYTTRSNERVTIYTSNSYAVDEATNQRWADFLAGLIHGSELSTVTVFFATPVEANRLCSDAADLLHDVLGCYGSSTIVAPGQDTAKASAESVLTHEYGHHIAANRSNAPWSALEWGAKRWASAMNICAMARSHVVFPGDESLLYRLNPGEGFAETYRWVNERVEGDPIGREAETGTAAVGRPLAGVRDSAPSVTTGPHGAAAALHLAAQDQELVPKHQDLQFLRARRPAKEHHQLEQTANHEVRKRPQHARPPTDGEADATEPLPQPPPQRVNEFLSHTSRDHPRTTASHQPARGSA